jgi:signal transduction histidine kinase
MIAPRSLAASVSRVQAAAVAVASITTVIVGTAAGAFTAVRQDDGTSIALAQALARELENHATDAADALARNIGLELTEQASFGRELKVYQRGLLVGGTDRSLVGLAPRARSGCSTERLRGQPWRVCSALTSSGGEIVVASPLGRVLRTTRTLVVTLLAAALATSALFLALSRRVLRRALSPLDELSAHVSAIEAAHTAGFSLPRRWGAQEIDAVASSFDALLSRVRHSVERERRFVADASHELRTPLTRLRGQLELLQSSSEDPSLQASLQGPRRACDLLVRTAESLLALAREDVPLEETVDVGDVAERAVLALIEHDRCAAARVRLDAPEEALVRGDSTLLGLALGNLIDNALKHTTGPISVCVTSGEVIQACISDVGPGVAPHDVERLIEPFARGAAPTAQGTGLGLALANHVARVHGGSLALRPGVPKGLTCVVSLPRWQPRKAEGSPAPDPPSQHHG